MNKRGLMVLVFLIAFSSFASASFEIGNLSHSIQSSYGPGETLKGWVNMSFSNEFSNSLFEDCEIDYSASNPETTKSFSLDSGEEKIFGFKIIGPSIEINSINFDLESTAQESKINQIKIDFFNNGEFEKGNYKSSLNDGDKMENCFDSIPNSGEYNIFTKNNSF
jgi:hypothetical protein